MRLVWPASLTVVLVALSLGACVHEPKPGERAESFAAYSGTTIGGTPAAVFLRAHTARLVSKSSVSDKQAQPTQAYIGTATMVDPAGYFLTASHCLVGDAPELAFGHVGREFFIPARVVWRGDPGNGEPDLALLHAPRLPLNAFRWTKDLPKAGEPALAVGQDVSDTEGAVTACLAGRYLSSSPVDFEDTDGLWIKHTAPLHGGDSGGPLVTTDGELIGINLYSKSVLPLLPSSWRGGSVALRPNLAWLQALIRKDAHAHDWTTVRRD